MQKEKASKAPVKRLEKSILRSENKVVKRVLKPPKVKMSFWYGREEFYWEIVLCSTSNLYE